MFKLGQMGTFIIPIDLTDDYFENPWRELSRIKNDDYSPEVNLVNYIIDGEDGKTLFIDNLSSENHEKYGVDNSEELFYNLIEDPTLFNKLTKDLLKKYKKYTH